MRDRLDEWGDTSQDVSANRTLTSSVSRDAETALISLGYKPPQAARSIAVVMKEHPEIEDSEALIRLALKSMA